MPQFFPPFLPLVQRDLIFQVDRAARLTPDASAVQEIQVGQRQMGAVHIEVATF